MNTHTHAHTHSHMHAHTHECHPGHPIPKLGHAYVLAMTRRPQMVDKVTAPTDRHPRGVEGRDVTHGVSSVRGGSHHITTPQSQPPHYPQSYHYTQSPHYPPSQSPATPTAPHYPKAVTSLPPVTVCRRSEGARWPPSPRTSPCTSALAQCSPRLRKRQHARTHSLTR